MHHRLPNDWIPYADSVGIMHDMTGTPHTFEQFAQETDPAQATLMWNSYERGDQRVIPKEKKMADARKANEIFNTKHVKFDKAKFEKTFKRSAGHHLTVRKSNVRNPQQVATGGKEKVVSTITTTVNHGNQMTSLLT